MSKYMIHALALALLFGGVLLYDVIGAPGAGVVVSLAFMLVLWDEGRKLHQPTTND